MVYQPDLSARESGVTVDRVRWIPPRVAPNVWGLGFTSLLTDLSSEMLTAILPVYLVVYRGFSPLSFGAIDGLYQGVTALVRWIGGFAADRTGRHKEVAATGYMLSAACKLGWLALGGTVGSAAALVSLDRAGKGIRTAPRDALISLSAPRGAVGGAFGIHRSLDATGAMLGPLLAFSVLAAAPNRFDAVFLLSFGLALMGAGILLVFVRNVEVSPGARGEASLVRAVFDLGMSADYRLIILAGSALALVTVSDAFVYLSLQRQLGFAAEFLPLLFVATSLAYLLLAVPAGYLVDRIGGPVVFIAGHGVLLLVYALLLNPRLGHVILLGCPVLLGVYYAATDGVLPALASGAIPVRLRGSGLALLATATSLCRLWASLLFGWIWTRFDQSTAVVAFGTALALVILPVALFLRQLSPQGSDRAP